MGKAVKDQLGRIIERESAPQPAVILVRPQLGENIGAACRGMLNFGLTELRLVAPRDGWPNPAADAMAAGAVELIENAKLFETVDDAVADLSFVLAATARRRELEIPVVGTDVVGGEMRAKIQQGVGVLFGPEKAGLTNADVVFADKILTYPVNPAFQSLNLAQAVNVGLLRRWRRGEERRAGFRCRDRVNSQARKPGKRIFCMSPINMPGDNSVIGISKITLRRLTVFMRNG